MTELAEIMGTLKGEWLILKNDKAAKIDRRKACKTIIDLSIKAQTLDKKFNSIDMNMTQYAEFVPKDYKVDSNVNWEIIELYTEEEKKALELLKRLEGVAVAEIHQKLPNEPLDSQKFGMIVSAYTEKLVHIYCHQN